MIAASFLSAAAPKNWMRRAASMPVHPDGMDCYSVMSGKRLLIGGSEQARRTDLVLRAYKLGECSRAHVGNRPHEPRGNRFWATSHPSRFPASCHDLAENRF
jgi:hypothetical protein